MKKSGAAIIFTDGVKILILQRNDEDRYWDFPGGTLYKNENPLQGAKRECKEEIGVFPTEYKLGDVKYDDSHFKCFMMYVDETFPCELNAEHVRYIWADLKDFPRYDLLPPIRKNVKNIMESIKYLKNESLMTFEEFVSIKEIAGATFDLAAAYKKPKPDTYQVEGDPSSMIRPKKKRKSKKK